MLSRVFSSSLPRAAARFSTAVPTLAEDPMSSGPKDIPDKLSLTFSTPNKALFEKEDVFCTLIPSMVGMTGVLPGHVAIVTELKAGVVVVQKEADGPMEQFFVPAGFAVMNDDSTLNITVPEAVAIDDIDVEAARAAHTEYSNAFSSASTDEDRARAQIGAELYGTMVNAVTMDVFA